MLSVRRMDGQLWPQIGNVPPHKAKTPKGWPGSGFFGIPSLKDKEYVILVEGLPDDLAAHCLLASGQFPAEDYGVVCALSAKSALYPRPGGSLARPKRPVHPPERRSLLPRGHRLAGPARARCRAVPL
jgi:hypothetical protein